ncbi:putative Copper-resistance protein [Cocos nucifera]|uniref:Putative Copper-resistance protein n=1 Tax=Cocos nucifera TaxID=13894 RepID=A0A8K0MZF2_COCNU|nr:putative Copper-resistance protein [Cocos nucifera]
MERHGVRQMRTAWADGPAYITQCPIPPSGTYAYRFTVEGQRGILFWHAHISWQRASVHGAFIIRPRTPYPFSTPIQADIPIILGEWWNSDVLAVEEESIKYGGGPNISDAYTINGLPGPLPSCSINQDTFIQTVEPGETYMLRLINAALNDELFFAIDGHNLTVVMEMVLQDTSFINAENHPIHVHGHNFFVVGRGFGNFERERDRAGYNLEDPLERNTAAVPSGGWAAIRLTADNPGVWFVHCHLEVHTMWRLGVGFVVESGADESQSILPPPDDLPPC